MTVLFIWRGPSPYRVDFFNELGKYCDLTVLFERTPEKIHDKDRTWFHEDFSSFHGIYLKGFFLFGKIWFCYNIFHYLLHIRKYDIVIVGMYSTLTQMIIILLCKLFGIKYWLNSDGGFIKKEDGILRRNIKRFFISGADAYLSSSRKTSEYLRYYGAKGSIYVYPFTSFSRKDVQKNISVEIKKEGKRELRMNENIAILFSGQFIYRKGIDVLLKSRTMLPDNCSFYIVGGKPTNEYLEIVHTNKLKNIYFIPFKSPKDLALYYVAADIYVLPTREDIWGLVINEAMAYGLPIVTTNNCLAGLELIEDSINGFIVPINDYKSLAEKLNILIENATLREEMGRNNRKKIQHYTIEDMAKAHWNFLREHMK